MKFEYRDFEIWVLELKIKDTDILKSRYWDIEPPILGPFKLKHSSTCWNLIKM